MYAKADDNSPVVSQVIYGHQVEILDEDKNYTYIKSTDDYKGWVNSSCLTPQKKSNSKKIRTAHNIVHLYHTPHVTKQKPLLSLPYGVELNVIQELPEEKDRWIEVELLNHERGWIQRGNITCSNAKLDLDQMFNLGRQFLGLPYTWGGTSSFGFDCSGFIQTLFREKSIELPRDAHQQIECCEPIKIISSGDLIFYGSGPSKIQHVSLYLANDQIIHASVIPIPLVQISPIDEPTLKERFPFSTFRRIS